MDPINSTMWRRKTRPNMPSKENTLDGGKSRASVQGEACSEHQRTTRTRTEVTFYTWRVCFGLIPTVPSTYTPLTHTVGEFEHCGDGIEKEEELFLSELGHNGTSLDHPLRLDKDEMYGFKYVVFGIQLLLSKTVFFYFP